jgi:putative flippase GtrA
VELVELEQRDALRLRGPRRRDREHRVTAALPLGQFGRFVVVGASNTAISFVAYALLVSLSTPYVLAAAVAFALGAVNGYVLNRRWTFAARDSGRARLVYAGVQTAGVLTTSLLVWLLVHEAAAGRIGAYAGAIPPVTVSMFLANRLWTFADRN